MFIGELAALAGCDAGTIRFYEKQRLLPPPARTASGYRAYGPDHVRRLHFIRHCRSIGLGLGEIRLLQNLQDHPQQTCSDIDHLLDKHIAGVDQQISAMRELKKRLLDLRRQCSVGRTIGECGILSSLAQQEDSPAR